MKLRELQQLTEATRQEQATSRASQQFNSTVISQLIAGIDQGLKNGTVVAGKPAQNTASVAPVAPTQNTAPVQTPAQTPAQIRQQKQATAAKTAQSQMAQNTATPTPNVAQQAAQTRQQRQAAAAQTAQAGMTPKQVQPTTTPKTPEQIRQEKQAAAAQAARTSMTPKPAPVQSKFKGPKINGLQLRNMGESKKFQKLNRILESIININELAGAPAQSISSFIQSQLPVITKSKIFSTSPYKEAVAKIADEVESTYAADKGQNALNKLADFSWSSLTEKTPKIGQSSNPSQSDPAQAGWPTGVPKFNKFTGEKFASPEDAQSFMNSPEYKMNQTEWEAAQAGTQSGQPPAPEQEKQSKVGVKQINKIIPTLRKRDLLSVKKNIDNTLAGRGSAPTATTTPAPGNNAFGQMAGQLSGSNASKSSTGGTTTTTPTGRVHTAAKTNPPAQATATPPVDKDNVVKMPKGRVRAAREGGVTPEEQAKFDEKVKQAMANQKG